MLKLLFKGSQLQDPSRPPQPSNQVLHSKVWLKCIKVKDTFRATQETGLEHNFGCDKCHLLLWMLGTNITIGKVWNAESKEELPLQPKAQREGDDTVRNEYKPAKFGRPNLATMNVSLHHDTLALEWIPLKGGTKNHIIRYCIDIWSVNQKESNNNRSRTL